MNRREFLKAAFGAGMVGLAAREAILRTNARDLARQPDNPAGVTAFGSGPGDADSFARLLSPVGSSGQYLRSNGSAPAWATPVKADISDFAHALASSSHSDVERGTDSVVLSTTANAASKIITFPTAYAAGTTPDVQAWIMGTLPAIASSNVTLESLLDFLIPTTAAINWALYPSAQTEFLGLTLHQKRFDRTPYTIIQMSVYVSSNTVGSGTEVLALQYSSDGTSWTTIETITIAGQTGWLFSGSSIDISALPLGMIYWRLVGSGGDDAGTVGFGPIMVMFRHPDFGLSFIIMTRFEVAVTARSNTQFTVTVSRTSRAGVIASQTVPIGWKSWLP